MGAAPRPNPAGLSSSGQLGPRRAGQGALTGPLRVLAESPSLLAARVVFHWPRCPLLGVDSSCIGYRGGRAHHHDAHA